MASKELVYLLGSVTFVSIVYIVHNLHLIFGNEILWQASLISHLPPHLLKLSEATKLTANSLTPLVSWVNDHVYVFSCLLLIICEGSH